MILEGTVKISHGDSRRVVKIWKGEHFSPNELDAFLSEEQNPMFDPVWNAYKSADYSWEFKECALTMRTYAIDYLKYLRSLGLDDLANEIIADIKDG